MLGLFTAIQRGDAEAVKAALRAGAPVDARDCFGGTPLQWAAAVGSAGIVAALLDAGADVGATDLGGYTPLHVAACTDSPEVAKRLLSRGADPDVRSSKGMTPLHLGIWGSTAQLLAAVMADVVTPGEEGETLLHLAARAGRTDVAAVLLERGADVNAATEWGTTPLHEAAMAGEAEIAALLLRHGADVQAGGAAHCTPLAAALCSGHAGMVRLLLDAGVDPHTSFDNTSRALSEAAVLAWLEHPASAGIDAGPVLLHAVAHNLAGVVRMLLQRGADPNARDAEGHSLLQMASSRPVGLEVVRVLLAAGVNPNESGPGGWTPLHQAACWADPDVVRMLLDAGADLEARSDLGETPLMQAAGQSRGGEATLRLLLERGAGLSARNRWGATALHSAAWRGYWPKGDALAVLLEAGADPNARDRRERGETPLDIAARKGSVEHVSRLLDAGADIHASDPDGWTALHYAASEGQEEVVRLLLERGAGRGLGPTGRHSLAEVQAMLAHALTAARARESAPGRWDGARARVQGETALHGAAATGDIAAADALLAEGADVNYTDPDEQEDVFGLFGGGPLHRAAAAGEAEMVAFLIDRGARVELRAGDGQTPLHRAARVTHPATVRLLLERGANPNARGENGETPLHRALWGSDEDIGLEQSPEERREVVELLLAAGADPNARLDPSGWLPLALAVSKPETVELLLEHGADVRGTDWEGWSVLHRLAAGFGDAGMAPRFVDRGADVNARDREGWTPLHLAARHGHLDMVAALLDVGAEIDARGGRVPSIRECQACHLRVELRGAYWAAHAEEERFGGGEPSGPSWVDLLPTDGEAVETLDMTPLMVAAREGRADTVDLLASRGADRSARDAAGKSALDWAEGRDAVTEVLLGLA